MARMMRMLLLVSVLSLAACGGGKQDDPFTADMKMICDAGKGHDDVPPELRRIEALRSIAEKVKTAEAARLMASFAQVAPAERGALLAPALAKAGIKRCALFADWQ
jgi:hypothetical protein